MDPEQEELEELAEVVVCVPEGEVLVGALLDGSGVGMSSFPIVIMGHDGNGGGAGGG